MKLSKYSALAALLFVGEQLFGQAVQAATPAANKPDALAGSMAIVLVTGAIIVFVVSLWAIVRSNAILYKNYLRMQAEAKGIPLASLEPAVAPEATGDDFWTRMRKKYWEDAVPVEREQEVLLEHGFDGIRELDNSLPPWWLNMFYITIIWAVGYMIYYHWGGNGPSSGQEYEMEMEQAKKEVAMAIAGKSEQVDENTVAALTDGGAIGEGELIYKANCAACHGQAGEGTVGPNLTDDHWIHGGGIKNVFKTIKHGVPEKGMIAWSATLSSSNIQKVASYILTLHGTNPPNAKAPQGEIWKEEGAAAPDSTATK